MRQWIKEVARGKKGSKDLTYEQAMEAAQTIIAGQATDAQIAAFLVAERIKSETPNEILAFVHALQRVSQKIEVNSAIAAGLIDFAGPYNGRNTFAATIPVSILLADQGGAAFLHSSDTLPPREGLALYKIVEGLGIRIGLTPKQLSESIQQAGLAFAITEQLCIPLANIRHVREEIGVRTFINTAEKMLNLTHATSIMLGVFHKTVIESNAAVLRALGFHKTYIVQGVEGSEDIPVHRKSFLYEISQDEVRSFDVDPQDYGLKHTRDKEKEQLTLKEQVSFIQAILNGEKGTEVAYFRDQVLINAGVRYYLFGMAPNISDGIKIADQQLQNKQGKQRLEHWQKISQQV